MLASVVCWKKVAKAPSMLVMSMNGHARCSPKNTMMKVRRKRDLSAWIRFVATCLADSVY